MTSQCSWLVKGRLDLFSRHGSVTTLCGESLLVNLLLGELLLLSTGVLVTW